MQREWLVGRQYIKRQRFPSLYGNNCSGSNIDIRMSFTYASATGTCHLARCTELRIYSWEATERSESLQEAAGDEAFALSNHLCGPLDQERLHDQRLDPQGLQA